MVAITGRSSNFFRATISALTGRNPAQRFRSRACPVGSRSDSFGDGEQNRKIFLTFFNRPLAKIFSIRETKIFLFCLPANTGIAETLSHPQRGGPHSKTFGLLRGKQKFSFLLAP